MKKTDVNTVEYQARYRVIFEKQAFQAMNKGHRRRLYSKIDGLFQPPYSPQTYKSWFLYPESVLEYKPERRDYILEAMLESLTSTLSAIVAEMDTLQAEIDLYRPIYTAALTSYTTSVQVEPSKTAV